MDEFARGLLRRSARLFKERQVVDAEQPTDTKRPLDRHIKGSAPTTPSGTIRRQSIVNGVAMTLDNDYLLAARQFIVSRLRANGDGVRASWSPAASLDSATTQSTGGIDSDVQQNISHAKLVIKSVRVPLLWPHRDNHFRHKEQRTFCVLGTVRACGEQGTAFVSPLVRSINRHDTDVNISFDDATFDLTPADTNYMLEIDIFALREDQLTTGHDCDASTNALASPNINRRSTSLRSLKSTLSRSFSTKMHTQSMFDHPYASAFHMVAKAEIDVRHLIDADQHVVTRIFVPNQDAISCLPFDSHLTTRFDIIPFSCCHALFEGILTLISSDGVTTVPNHVIGFQCWAVLQCGELTLTPTDSDQMSFTIELTENTECRIEDENADIIELCIQHHLDDTLTTYRLCIGNVLVAQRWLQSFQKIINDLKYWRAHATRHDELQTVPDAVPLKLPRNYRRRSLSTARTLTRRAHALYFYNSLDTEQENKSASIEKELSITVPGLTKEFISTVHVPMRDKTAYNHQRRALTSMFTTRL